MSDQKLEDIYKGVLETIRLYPDQLKQAWDEVTSIDTPDEYKFCDKIVLCGMGGSALGARVVDSLLVNRIRLPFEIFNQYNIPNYSDDKTLVICYSYSGNTEETVSALKDAILRESKVFVISSGGQLKDIAQEHNLPMYLIDPKYNPSGQPRNALGYSIGSILALFKNLEFATFFPEEIDEAVAAMKAAFNQNDPKNKDILAKSLADKIKDKALILVASEHLYGVSHAIKNQFNESAKTFAALFELPELNHHLMEGLENPRSLKNDVIFMTLESSLYLERIQARYELTKEIFEKQGYKYISYKPLSEKKLSQVFEVLCFGSLIVYYLGRSYGIDPNKIPWVDHFKKKLSEM
ncbi:hypothetical protein JXA63_00725 [Candidatus Woesebacteria bacterium]|nr:hypothetical protein [Candidatus Woesebacteria bacterium]